MAIIYAPIIADTIPAFGGTDIIIPYTHNSAVSEEDVKGFSLKVKNMITSEIVYYDEYGYNSSPGKVKFTLVDLSDHLTPGQYYKFQLAYNYDGGTSPYSSVSLGRYIGNKPDVGLKRSGLECTGSYKHEIETLYKYRYDLYQISNNEEKLLKTSDWILYDGNIKPFNIL